MKQTLQSETARVRRVPFRAITFSLGLSAFAMACSFGQIDSEGTIGDVAPPSSDPDAPTDVDTSNPGDVDTDSDDVDSIPDNDTPPDSNFDKDMFASEMGQTVKEILETNCGGCHANGVRSGSMDYILDFEALYNNKQIIPGNKEDSRIFVRMQQQSMPPAFMRDQRPTYGQIELVGQWIDEMEGFDDPDDDCTGLEGEFVSLDSQIAEMADDIGSLDADDRPFTRYLTVSYSNNAGECGRALQRQRYALFKGINSLSIETEVVEPVAIDDAKLIYRIDIRDYGWDRAIDLEDDGIVDFNDAWLAILDGVDTYAVEFAGDDADDLKADAEVNVPFLPVNAFTQFSQINDLYYALIGARANLFDYELDVLGIDTVAEIADDNLMRAGFANSGVSKQDRVLNRFNQEVAAGLSYWISFDFDGGNGNGGVGGVSNGFEINVANESIFADPLAFAFAGGEAIFSLPNGMQGYYVAAANGARLNEAPVGVVIDPAQNNGLVTNGASCHSCHNAGLIDFRDTVKPYVIENRTEYDNFTYEAVLAQYPDPEDFLAQMALDSEMHVAAAEDAGVPRGTPDAISRIFLDFQLRLTPSVAAGDLQVPLSVLQGNAGDLDPRLAALGDEGGRVERVLFTQLYLDSMCVFHQSSENSPVGCP